MARFAVGKKFVARTDAITSARPPNICFGEGDVIGESWRSVSYVSGLRPNKETGFSWGLPADV
jgi:hypothetical protein